MTEAEKELQSYLQQLLNPTWTCQGSWQTMARRSAAKWTYRATGEYAGLWSVDIIDEAFEVSGPPIHGVWSTTVRRDLEKLLQSYGVIPNGGKKADLVDLRKAPGEKKPIPTGNSKFEFKDGQWVEIEIFYEGSKMSDSGERQTLNGGMVREPRGDRIRWTVLCATGIPYADQVLTRFARWMTEGAKKYGLRNWEKGRGQEPVEQAMDSLLAHVKKYEAGETDEDHAAAIMANVYMIESTRYWNQIESDTE